MTDKRQQHNQYQQSTFDQRVYEFCETIPVDIQQRMKRIVAVADLLETDRILDVGTGTGVLIPYFRMAGVDQIVACDISEVMLVEARRRNAEVEYWRGDVVDLPRELGSFDAVFCNAMFGNVCDQRQTLESVAARLTQKGRVIISHPMGSSFQIQLHREHPQLVPHQLPNRKKLNKLVDGLSFQVSYFQDCEQLYIACLTIA